MSPLPEKVTEVEEALARADVPLLQSLAAGADKRIGKAAKRALYLLRARGVAIPDRGPPAPVPAEVPRLRQQEEEPREPFLSTAVDGSGERDVFMPVKAPLGFVLHLAVLSDENGILELTSRQLSRRQLRAFMAEVAQQARELLREIPVSKAAALLAAAIELNPGSPDVPEARELLRALEIAKPPGREAPDVETTTESPPGESAALRESTALFESPALSSYVPPRETIEAAGQKLEEVMVSPLLVDESQRLAQMRHALQRAVADFFTPRRRALYGARLHDAAELFSSRGELASAAQARAVAAALASDRPIHEIPFARGMFERIFDLEAAAKSRPAPGKDARSPGGLILP